MESMMTSGICFRNKPIILEPHDSTNRVYNHEKTRPMRLSTCQVESSTLACEQSPRGYVYMYEMKKKEEKTKTGL